MPIEWNAQYETGEKRVDAQHQRLFGYVNELHEMIQLVQQGQELNRQAVDDLLFHLESYVTVHFAYEEMCMGMHHCPKAATNKDAHDRLIAFYGDFLEKARQELTLEMLVTLENTLVHWLTNHICKIDMNIKERFQEEAEQRLHTHKRQKRHSIYGLRH